MAEHTNLLLDSLPVPDREILLSLATRIRFELGQDLITPGQMIDVVHFPVSGIISTVNEMADGRSVEAFMVGREGVAGIEATVIPMASASRQTIQLTGEAYRIDAGRIRALAHERPALRQMLALYHAGIQRELEQTAACHALHPAERRLAKWLLRCHDRADSDTIKLTQEYMASMLGSQRTTVNEAAQTLQAHGAVRYSRGTVHVLNRAALEASACECYRKVAVLRAEAVEAA
ncbi:Crp/Fnr family transcriptional regulator [Brevundimonas sp. GCM10030266]|uniref:Crp/Fnr family transcriptional regulator n=1 Tax=Brevundimonas sp. GCM10030266 TaxID=3273386 RepID=UPI00361FC971